MMPKRMSMQFRQTCHVIRVRYENNKRERKKKEKRKEKKKHKIDLLTNLALLKLLEN